ncbi:polysaccharide biosynthesis C-terminal domain-containing protein [Saccharothrix stipae]
MTDLPVSPLTSFGDRRGVGFSLVTAQLAAFGPIADVHVASVRPGHVRGEHHHPRGELLAVVYSDAWSLHWDTGAGTATHHRSFTGSGGVVVAPPPGWAHAVRNDGAADLWLFVASDAPYDPATTFPRRVTD